MESPPRISASLARVHASVRAAKSWLTSDQVAKQACVSPRTARSCCLLLVGLGVFDQASVFPGYRYRYSDLTSKDAKKVADRIAAASEVFKA